MAQNIRHVKVEGAIGEEQIEATRLDLLSATATGFIKPPQSFDHLAVVRSQPAY
jgi:hypothetical protein